MLGLLGALWGVTGIVFILASAVISLYPQVVDALGYPLDWYHWLVLWANVLLMAYYEGYKGFQKSFSPRVAARARYLRDNPTMLQVFLSPIFCLGYFHSTRTRQQAVILLTLMILFFIFVVREFSQPWRGIVDAGVVVGLSWGLLSLLYYCYLGLVAEQFDHSPELPETLP